MPESPTYSYQDLAKLARNYLDFLLNRKRQHAEELIVTALQKGVPIKDIYLYVFQPVQWEIGELWQKNKISVAMEHYCTAATQFVMSRLYNYIFSYQDSRKNLNLIATSVSGELHELGIRMVSDFFEMEGWNTYYLGANSTKEGILSMINECDADLLAISVTIFFNIPEAEELISYVKEELKNTKLKIIVGGKAFKTKKELWQATGADLFAQDAQDAIDKANELFS